MWRPLLIIFLIFATLYGVYYYLNKPEISEFNSTLINTKKVPFQSMAIRPFSKPIKSGNLNVSISPAAKYSISARILSKRKYVRGWESKLSNWDIVFGWGKAADMDKIENLEIRQVVRWYSYRISANIPMSQPYIATHTSNNHIIPSTENVRRALLFLKKFDVVQMDGYLVNVSGNNGIKYVNWITSVSREDTGGGSCEIFLVESVKIGDKIYR